MGKVHLKVSEKDIPGENELLKRDDASSSRRHKIKYSVCIHSSIFLQRSFQEEVRFSQR